MIKWPTQIRAFQVNEGDTDSMDDSYAIHEDDVEKVELVGRVVSPLVTNNLGARNLLLSAGIYERGQTIPSHKHEKEEEAIYVIAGIGEIAIGDKVEQLRPGSAAYIPPGVEHQLSVHRDTPMKLVFVFSPPVYPGSYEVESSQQESKS